MPDTIEYADHTIELNPDNGFRIVNAAGEVVDQYAGDAGADRDDNIELARNVVDLIHLDT